MLVCKYIKTRELHFWTEIYWVDYYLKVEQEQNSGWSIAWMVVMAAVFSVTGSVLGRCRVLESYSFRENWVSCLPLILHVKWLRWCLNRFEDSPVLLSRLILLKTRCQERCVSLRGGSCTATKTGSVTWKGSTKWHEEALVYLRNHLAIKLV